MTRLSDSQAIVLGAAAQRLDGDILPLPGSLRGGAASKVVTALLTRGLIHEQVTDNLARADAAMNTVWRNDDDGRAVLLRITPAGLDALGFRADGAAARPNRRVREHRRDSAAPGAPAALRAPQRPPQRLRQRTESACKPTQNTPPAISAT